MNQMGQKIVAMIALGTFALVIGLGELRQAQAQEAKEPYPSMAPLDQYLMADRNAEIAMARSAAPESISRDAKVLVLGGMATKPPSRARMVSCASWSEGGWAHSMVSFPLIFGTLKFEVRSAYNPPAARSILPMTYKRTEMVLAGQSKAQIIDGIKTFIKQELPPLEPGAMSYMMSKEQYLTDDGHHNWIAHLMFYTPLMDGAVWGADLPNSPVMLNPQFDGAPEPIDVFMIPAGWWSDGTADPVNY